jgi:hypothetical protein
MKRPTPYQIGKEKQETYALNVQSLMNLIPNATVAKHTNTSGVEIFNKHSTKWSIDNTYVVYSSRFVYTIANDGTEDFKFFMKPEDYKKFEEACEARRQELFGKKQKNK